MIKFNKNNNMIIPFTILLSNRNQEILGEIVNTSAVNFTGHFNSANELSFTVYKTLDGYEEPLWDEIFDLRLVYIQELQEYFEISVSMDDQDYLTKTITATSLCEAELAQTMLYDIEINTEIDIEREDYKVAKFWTNNTDPQSEEYKSTILYRVLEKVPAYSVKHVDYTLINLQRVFSINGKSVYDWLTSDCATEFNCLVKFDSTDRTISFYDLYTTCPVCHSRGLYNDVCTHIITQSDIDKYGSHGMMPNEAQIGQQCGNTNLNYYGEDTTIYVSTKNLTDEIKYETATDQIKNSFRLIAGDDDMTAAIVNINPNGSQYIYNYSPESLRDMPDVLVQAIKDYNVLYDEYNYSKEYNINLPYKTYYFYDVRANGKLRRTIRANYNTLVEKYATSYYQAKEEELKTIPTTIIGYADIMEHIYQCLDFNSYLESSMMPKVEIGNVTAATEANKITTNFDGQNVSISNFSQSTTSSTVNSAIINCAKLYVKTGFVRIEVDESSVEYTTGSSVWRGRIRVIDNSLDESDSAKYAYAPSQPNQKLTIHIDDDYEDFMFQKIKKKIQADLDDMDDTIEEMLASTTNLEAFKLYIKAFSLNRLKSFKDSLEAVLGILQEANIALNPKDQKSSVKKEMYRTFYQPYLRKFQACEEEYNLRANELSIIADYQGGVMTTGVLYSLLSIRNDVHKALDFKAFLDARSNAYNQANSNLTGFENIDLYKLLSTYTRQQEYTNSNYISTGLDNADLFAMAKMYYEGAYEELLKSSTYQHSITSNMYNLLAMEEFKPIVDKFELGNWIRVATDDQVYRLRLIGYSVNFDDPTTLSTEFSDVTATGVGYNDLQSILSQAKGIGGSYPAVTRQAEQGKLASDGINEWVKKGLNSAHTRIMNNDQEEIEIDNTGMTAKTYDDITDSYDKEQLRITHNVLAFTDDNWETVRAALGKFTLTHHNAHTSNTDEHEEETYGLVADAVLAGKVIGSLIEGSDIIGGHIQSAGNKAYIDLYNSSFSDPAHNYPDFIHYESGNSQFIVTKDGNLSTTGGHFSNGIAPNIQATETAYLDLNRSDNPYPYFLSVGDTSSSSSGVFKVTKNDGTIITRGGHFQNYNNSSYIDLGYGNQQTTYLDNGTNLRKKKFDYFLVSSDVNVFSVSKEGYLIATSGQVGGFYISTNYISSTTFLSDNTNSHITLSTAGFNRDMNVPVVDRDEHNKLTIVIRERTLENLRFAIGNYFCVNASGNVYANNLYSVSLTTGDISCINLEAADDISCDDISCDSIIATGLSKIGKLTFDYNTITVEDNISTDNGTLIINDSLKIEKDGSAYQYVGNNWYRLFPVQFGQADPPASLPDGLIYLQYE